MSTQLTLFYKDELEVDHQVECAEFEYNNLMELLFDKKGQEWGDCKGRAWCGTCHIMPTIL